MLSNNDEGLQSGSGAARKFSSDKLHNVEHLFLEFLVVVLETVWSILLEGVLYSLSPIDGVDCENDLTGLSLHPIGSLALVKVLDSGLCELLEGLAHDVLNFKHPLLDITLLCALVHIDRFGELNDFLLG